jgi:hypothetical protein
MRRGWFPSLSSMPCSWRTARTCCGSSGSQSIRRPTLDEKSDVSPTAPSLAHLRDLGYRAKIVEKTIPHTFIKKDLWGRGRAGRQERLAAARDPVHDWRSSRGPTREVECCRVHHALERRRRCVGYLVVAPSRRKRREETLVRAERAAVTCARCHGVLVDDRTVDEGTVWAGYRCPICGDRIDELILQHRRLWPRPEPAREHALPVYRPNRGEKKL